MKKPCIPMTREALRTAVESAPDTVQVQVLLGLDGDCDFARQVTDFIPYLASKDYHIAELLIRHHRCDDQAAVAAIAAELRLTAKDKARAKKLCNICKDMDGLDRVRFNGLDYRFLRTPYARKLPLVAGGLLKEDVAAFLEAIPPNP